MTEAREIHRWVSSTSDRRLRILADEKCSLRLEYRTSKYTRWKACERLWVTHELLAEIAYLRTGPVAELLSHSRDLRKHLEIMETTLEGGF